MGGTRQRARGTEADRDSEIEYRGSDVCTSIVIRAGGRSGTLSDERLGQLTDEAVAELRRAAGRR